MADATGSCPPEPEIVRPDVELVADARARVGESPVWSPADSAIWWIDVKAPALHRTAHPDGSTRSWSLPWDVGGFALCADPPGESATAALLALRLGLCTLDLESGGLTCLVDAPFDPRTHRFNETGCDPDGRLWIGTMYDPPDAYVAEPAAGPLYSFAPAEGLRRHDVRALTANGFAWSADGRGFYAADTDAGTIERRAFDAAAGRVGDAERFAAIDPSLGQPDGAALDAEGGYWCAVHGGGRLHRYTPDGRLERAVLLPVDCPTKPVFAGPELDVMYVTSATHGKADARPHEGALLRFRPGVRGAPAFAYGDGGPPRDRNRPSAP